MTYFFYKKEPTYASRFLFIELGVRKDVTCSGANPSQPLHISRRLRLDDFAGERQGSGDRARRIGHA